MRVKGLGIFLVLDHVVAYWVFGYASPHRFENFWLRLVMAASALPFIFSSFSKEPKSYKSQLWLTVVVWLQLPVMFSFMFVMNDGSGIRLATLTGVVLIYYQLTDWRLATFGIASGLLLGSCIALGIHNPQFVDLTSSIFILSIDWMIALFLGVSRANQRQMQLTQAVNTMAVMSNEMRPAISTISLVGRALRSEANAAAESLQGARLKSWGHRLELLSRSLRSTMNNQVANAHLLELGLPGENEQLKASMLVQEVHAAYPYRSERERECVEIVVRRDFNFTSSHMLFSEVLNNLIRNGLHAVLTSHRKLVSGDVLIEVGVIGGHGRIIVSDRGVGMTQDTKAQAFDAFFSTDRLASHGLGLTFCRQVVQAAGGTIVGESVLGFGASFTIEFAQIEPIRATPTEDDESELDNWDLAVRV